MCAGARCSRKSPPGSPPLRSVLPGSLRNSASRTAEAGPGRARVLATLQNGDNQEQCVPAVHIPASPRPPSLGLLGPDRGGPVCLVGPWAEAALQGFFPPLSLCPFSGLVPLWPVHPSRPGSPPARASPRAKFLYGPCTLSPCVLGFMRPLGT